MNISNKAIGVKWKRGDTEVVVATDKVFPHQDFQFMISTKIKKLPSAEELVDEVNNGRDRTNGIL